LHRTGFKTILSSHSHSQELKGIFRDYGITEIEINRDSLGRSRGYGFVEFMNEEERNRVLEEKKGVIIRGRLITLEAAIERVTGSTH
jgi:RNA recognition motif-containing protein